MKYFDKWDDIPLEVYQLTLSEVKENFTEVLSEVTSTTNKSIKMMLVFGIFVMSAGSTLIEKETILCIDIVLYSLSVLVIIWLYFIIRGRPSHRGGLEVENLLSKDFAGRKYSAYEKQQIIYKNAIKKYQLKICQMTDANRIRANNYNIIFGITIGLTIAIATYCALL